MPKKYFKILIALAAAVIINGCDKTDVVNVDTSYQEYAVVQGELYADENFNGITITRTLPLGVSYSISLAEIRNAVAYMRINGVKIIPLLYSSAGRYLPKNTLKPQAGDTYELFAEIGDKTIYSTTKIPHVPNITSASFNTSGRYIETKVMPESGFVYGALWYASEGSTGKAPDFYSIESAAGTGAASIVVRTQMLPYEYPAHNMAVRVYAFDKEYLPYFQTKSGNEPISDSFTQSSSKINWNVRGDHVIGMFIGINKTDLIGVN